MERVVVHFKNDSLRYINVEATDIFEQGEYLYIYNGEKLVAMLLKDTIKIIYKTTRKED